MADDAESIVSMESNITLDDGGVFPVDPINDSSSIISNDSQVASSSTSSQFKIKNKQRRRETHMKKRREQMKLKMKERKSRQKMRKTLGEDAVCVNKQITIDNRREKEDSMVEINDQEVMLEDQSDEFASYFTQEVEPKILLTTSDRPRSYLAKFVKQLQESLPNCHVFYRRAIPVKSIVTQAIARGFTDIMVVNEDRKKPNGLLLCHLPEGPTAYFKISNVKVRSEIKNSTTPSEHKPEVILNNFGTRLGHRIGRMFSSLYPQKAEFEGRQVVTFHNQRDFIFFRHHRYIFKDAKKVGLQEIGPSFTLKLRSLQKGTFDSKFGEFEWLHNPHDMDTKRKKFYL